MRVLHIGCGGSPLPSLFDGYTETRLDLDPSSGADLIGDMLDIPLPNGEVDAIYTCHTLEHVSYNDGLRALGEFRRVLKDGGMALVIVPNIGILGEHLTNGTLFDTLYDSPGGPVCAYDMIYGHQGLIERNGGQKAYRFAHRFGYTPETLTDSFAKAGFQPVNAKASGFDAMCVGYK